jgi:hypothetical protein
MLIDALGFSSDRVTQIIVAPFCYKVIHRFHIEPCMLHDLVTERCNRARDDVCIPRIAKRARSFTIGPTQPHVYCAERFPKPQRYIAIKKPTLASGLQRNVNVTTTASPLEES